MLVDHGADAVARVLVYQAADPQHFRDEQRIAFGDPKHVVAARDRPVAGADPGGDRARLSRGSAISSPSRATLASNSTTLRGHARFDRARRAQHEERRADSWRARNSSKNNDGRSAACRSSITIASGSLAALATAPASPRRRAESAAAASPHPRLLVRDVFERMAAEATKHLHPRPVRHRSADFPAASPQHPHAARLGSTAQARAQYSTYRCPLRRAAAAANRCRPWRVPALAPRARVLPHARRG